MSESDENSVKQAIEARLKEHLQPHFLQVEDVSWQHTGHAGARPGGTKSLLKNKGQDKRAG